MDGAGMALPAVTLSEAQAYVRIETGEEEAVLAGLIRTASALCEAFIGQVVIARPFEVLMAADQNGVPEPVRQGVLRLVAHLFASRDGDGGAPPAAVTALWRPYRRMRLA